MSGVLRQMAMVSMHTSPTATPGRGDAGGINVLQLSLARGLANRGIAVDLLTRAEAEPEVTELFPGVTLRTIAAGGARHLPESGMADVADAFGEAVATLVGRAAPRYDLLHAHFWLSGLATLPVALELGLPFVQSFHTLGSMKNAALADSERPEPLRRLRAEAFLASEADAVVAASSAEVSALIDDLHAPASHMWVIPPGVDTTLFTPNRAGHAPELRRRLDLEDDRPLMVMAGRIEPIKAQDLAIRILAAVHSLHGWAPLLVVAGEAPIGAEGYRDSLDALAEDLGVTPHLRFVGPLDRIELADLFAAAAVTLITSYSETFGLVALESAASGTPVVGYRSAGLLESVAEGESGVLVPTRDPAAWARTVSDLLDDELSLARLSASARRHAEGFTWATATRSLLGVYESLLGRTGD